MNTATVRIPRDLFEQLKVLSNQQLRSVPKTIEWLLREYKIRNESAQEYVEREPMKSLVLSAMSDLGESTTIEELFH